MRTLTVLLVVTVWLVSADQDEEFKLPSYVEVCYRDSPKVVDCIKKNIQKLVPKFKSGSKDFDLAPLDPMDLKDMVFEYNSIVVGGILHFPDLAVHGLSKIKVLDVRPKTKEPKKFALDFVGEYPALNLRGTYNLTGNFVNIPVKLNGNVDVIFEQVALAYHVAGDVETIGEYDYLILKNFDLRLKGEGIRHAYVNNDVMVEGRPALNRALITALNSNWRILKQNLLPALYPVADRITKSLFVDFFKKYPYDILFPKRTRSEDE